MYILHNMTVKMCIFVCIDVYVNICICINKCISWFNVVSLTQNYSLSMSWCSSSLWWWTTVCHHWTSLKGVQLKIISKHSLYTTLIQKRPNVNSLHSYHKCHFRWWILTQIKYIFLWSTSFDYTFNFTLCGIMLLLSWKQNETFSGCLSVAVG